jgi:hypothetical protein
MKKYHWVGGCLLGTFLLTGLWWGRGYVCAARRALFVQPDEAVSVSSSQNNSSLQPVTWTNLVNCLVAGRALRKNKGSNEMTDAGASSAQAIHLSNGKAPNAFVEFRAVETNKERYLGLTRDFTGTSHTTIDFAIHLTTLPHRGGTVAEVRENDVYKAETVFQPNDKFRLALEEGVVKYYLNEACFYTSSNKPSYPLVVDASFLHLGGSVSDVFISENSAAAQTFASHQASLVLSNFKTTMAPGGTALVTWNTDKPASTQIEYGLTPSYGNTVAVSMSDTSHAVSLAGLTKDTTYYYRVKARDIAGNLVTSNNMTFVTTPHAAGATAGLLEKDKILIPANYTTFTPPPAGGQYIDPVFGTTITRLGDGWKQLKDSIGHEYATMSPFNRDDSMILLQSGQIGFFIVNRKGEVLLQTWVSNSAEPRWSHTENDVFYYHEDNRLMKYNTTMKRATTVATFPQYERITFGGGECDISEDGDHLMVVGDMRHVGVFTLSAAKMGRTINLTALGEWAEVFITANNNVAVRWEGEGEGKYQGLGLFDGNMNFIRKVLTFGAHSDQARDVNGDEVIIIGAYRDPHPAPGCDQEDVEKVRLSDSKKTCLLKMAKDQEKHISANSAGKHHWVLVSGTSTRETAEMPGKLAVDWRQRWSARANELILVKVDGSEIRRIAHHRSRKSDFYYWQPRAALSKSGKYAIFDSNFGVNPIKDYVDPYLVQLTNEK